ncbi:MAG: hypothetical protein GY737_25145 [Desulfobacteraceae bacterium]|nr:hypothetical protein [Desulfobacteraceae bacterium]
MKVEAVLISFANILFGRQAVQLFPQSNKNYFILIPFSTQVIPSDESSLRESVHLHVPASTIMFGGSWHSLQEEELEQNLQPLRQATRIRFY